MEINDSSIDVEKITSVIVLDVEEPGVVTLPEGEPEIGVRLQATLEDGDGEVTGATWQWARSENPTSGFVNISGATSSSYTPGDADASVYLWARVEYTDRRGGGKSAQAVTANPVPGENRRPTFPDTEDGRRTIAENTRANRNVGAPVAATDPERNRTDLLAERSGCRLLRLRYEQRPVAHEGCPGLRDEGELQRHRRCPRRTGRLGQHVHHRRRHPERHHHDRERGRAGYGNAHHGHPDDSPPVSR